eukprot:NODE_3459_length_772_cov_95.381743_g2891_i0.p1 GENE.NODE_3459_length_772_cov_95.381743_g2891_i0~~NODE_3459_length_772_cov_95.381743_g2891_i0.p1  ORF type:complete len:209 (-),score=25.92 NODE_3459_length_772_cov_95.381743_g2891_i0:114-740(-)
MGNKFNLIRELPLEIGNMSSITHMELALCGLTSLPETFGKLSTLLELVVDNNPLTNLPTSFANLSSLSCLSMQSSLLSELPPLLADLPRLRMLDVSFSHNLMPADPFNITFLPQVKDFYALNTTFPTLEYVCGPMKNTLIEFAVNSGAGCGCASYSYKCCIRRRVLNAQGREYFPATCCRFWGPAPIDEPPCHVENLVKHNHKQCSEH